MENQTAHQSDQGSSTTAEAPQDLQPEHSDDARERLRQAAAEKCRDLGSPTVPSLGRGLGLGAVIASIKSRPLPPEPENAVSEEDAAKESARRDEWFSVSSAMGKRYEDCRLDCFKFYGTPDEQSRQKESIELCRKLAINLKEGISAYSGLVLFGPPGTGKDHILAAMLRAACWGGRSVKWINGLDFFGDMRDRMDSESPESAIITQLSRPDILAISDPLPPWGPLTAFQAQTLFRVIDRRYRQEKPIWVTINVAGSAEASERIGTAVVDRLKERALSVHCNWPSYRARKDS